MQEFTERQATTLAAMVDPDRFSTGQSNRELHLHDISFHQGKLPAGIVWPVATEEVSRVMAWAYENEVPVTPWGAGTSTEACSPSIDWTVPSRKLDSPIKSATKRLVGRS